MKAKQLMTKNPKICEPDHDLSCALDIMRQEDCGIVPITEGNGEARVVGVVTDRDIALHLGSTDARPSEVKVRDVMTTDLICCEPTDEVNAVGRKMEDEQVRRILVVDEGRLLGVIAIADLARAIGSGQGIGPEVQKVVKKVSQGTRERSRSSRRTGGRAVSRPRT